MRIQAFGTKGSVERLYERIVGRLPWPRKPHAHSVLICPLIHRLTRKFAPIVTVQKLRNTALHLDPLQGHHHIFAFQFLIRFNRQALPRVFIALEKERYENAVTSSSLVFVRTRLDGEAVQSQATKEG